MSKDEQRRDHRPFSYSKTTNTNGLNHTTTICVSLRPRLLLAIMLTAIRHDLIPAHPASDHYQLCSLLQPDQFQPVDSSTRRPQSLSDGVNARPAKCLPKPNCPWFQCRLCHSSMPFPHSRRTLYIRSSRKTSPSALSFFCLFVHFIASSSCFTEVLRLVSGPWTLPAPAVPLSGPLILLPGLDNPNNGEMAERSRALA